MYLRLGAIATLVVALVAAALGGIPSNPAFAQQGSEDFALPNGWFYTQTRGAYPPGYGFAVVDDGIQFWTTVRQLGGVAITGYPISQRFFLGGRPAQAFQRVILVWDPATGQASVLQTGGNLSLIPPEALVPARWTGPAGLVPVPVTPPVGGYGAPPAGVSPFGPAYGVPPAGVPFYGAPPGQPVPPPATAPYGVPAGSPYLYPFAPGYPFGFPFYAPYAPGVIVCDPLIYPFGCPQLAAPTPTNTPVPPGPPACSGDNTEIFFDPPHPTVGQRTLIKVTSSVGWEDVGLSGPLNPRFEGLSPGGLNWVWTWSVTPPAPGTYGYTFTINNGAGCVSSAFSTPGFLVPTNTPVPPHNTATPTSVPPHNTATPTRGPAQGAPQQPAAPAHPTATPTATSAPNR
ncbi:MAG: hypothetical protein K6U89_05335 [Chloroflexi bacterium]|nr:hypothetical protein [Chloroflexota bacterium]